MSVKTPVAVAIFQKSDDTYEYRAFSPITYDYMNHDHGYAGFLERLYSFIGHNPADPLNNATTYGALKEVVTLLSDTPVDKRGNMITVPLMRTASTAYKIVTVDATWYYEFEGGSNTPGVDEYKTIPHTAFQ